MQHFRVAFRRDSLFNGGLAYFRAKTRRDAEEMVEKPTKSGRVMIPSTLLKITAKSYQAALRRARARKV